MWAWRVCAHCLVRTPEELLVGAEQVILQLGVELLELLEVRAQLLERLTNCLEGAGAQSWWRWEVWRFAV